MGKKLKGKDLLAIGYPNSNTVNLALGYINRYLKKESNSKILAKAKAVLLNPSEYREDPIWKRVAESLENPTKLRPFKLKTERVQHQIFGGAQIDDQTRWQLYTALKLPVAVSGALMPDAHVGYGLPIGGVLATDNAVIPYAVGVDIGCRMALTIVDYPYKNLRGETHRFMNVLKDNTCFGAREAHKSIPDIPFFYDEGFKQIPFVGGLRKTVIKQLGSSGGGNHFVEFGKVEVIENSNALGVAPGTYLGILSHSGSRGFGAKIAAHFTKIAMNNCPLPKEAQSLAWLGLDTENGKEYWKAMTMAGDYAKACHDDIHRRILKALKLRPLKLVENHHNFAWKQIVNGKECIVHRKGATPASKGELGIIPGSMTSPGFIVEGLGNEQSLASASHGAGRLFSRAACKQNFRPSDVKKELDKNSVQLIGGSVEEAPMAYKSIENVMAAQQELVNILGKFTPSIVRMAK